MWEEGGRIHVLLANHRDDPAPIAPASDGGLFSFDTPGDCLRMLHTLQVAGAHIPLPLVEKLVVQERCRRRREGRPAVGVAVSLAATAGLVAVGARLVRRGRR